LFFLILLMPRNTIAEPKPDQGVIDPRPIKAVEDQEKEEAHGESRGCERMSAKGPPDGAG